MKKIFNKYTWLFEFIGAALLVGLGLIMKFVPDVLLILVGLIFAFLGIFRIIPLVKTVDDKVLKIIYASELLIDVAAGVVIFILGVKGASDSVEDTKHLFGYIIASILYLRGFVYLFATSIRKDRSNIFIFLLHIGILTLATVIFARGGFTFTTLGWVLMVIAMPCALFMTIDGVKKYSNYRGQEYALGKTKKMKIEKITNDKKEDMPTADEINVKIDNNEINDNTSDRLNA